MTEPLENAELLAFVRVVERKSLSRAAVDLEVPRATLGRRLARLEERLGTRLLRRTTRSMALTDAGEALYRHARVVLDAVSAAEASVRREVGPVRGAVRVSVPPLMSPALADLLTGFARAHPDVQLHVDFSSRHVDLRREGFDVAVRASRMPLEPGLVSRLVRKSQLVGVASPDYLAEHGTPRTVADLRHHRCLLSYTRGEHAETTWPRLSGKPVRVVGSFHTNEVRLLAHAAVEGLGIAVLPDALVRPLLTRGELVPVLPGVLGAEVRASIVFVERELMPPQVRALVDWLTQKLAPVLDAPVCEPGTLERWVEARRVSRRGASRPRRSS